MQTQIQRGPIDINVALISCTLFICIETWQGHSIKAVELYKQGLKMLGNIIHHSCRTKTHPDATILDPIIAIYIRLSTIAYITAGVLFELSATASESLCVCASLPAARISLTRLVAETS